MGQDFFGQILEAGCLGAGILGQHTMEVGAGDAVGTMRSLSERILTSREGAHLVRISAEQSGVEGLDRAVAVPMGGLAALQAIDKHLDAL